jgi:hypothetical protein
VKKAEAVETFKDFESEVILCLMTVKDPGASLFINCFDLLALAA